jgi:hypothetical protein
VKRTGRDEQIEVVTYTCKEITQEISLCSYLYLKLAKPSCFSNYAMFFSSTKSKNRREGLTPVGKGRKMTGKGIGG